ncbi:hypothetical protein PSRA_1636 [Pseudoscardovia radai]|uniref:Uncharacterized protein n=1 Tax=Pseudoscardovia radai TaxID=987066 RepID=A0A261ERA0_9BIFI|nr:hypothetical protein [Pseudoscardovia radai]OZG49387.1 hypothetical protein PSRA_1636 [Pseudoscardovia radai]
MWTAILVIIGIWLLCEFINHILVPFFSNTLLPALGVTFHAAGTGISVIVRYGVAVIAILALLAGLWSVIKGYYHVINEVYEARFGKSAGIVVGIASTILSVAVIVAIVLLVPPQAAHQFSELMSFLLSGPVK